MAAESTTPPAKCLKCQGHLASPIFCGGCQTLYPPPQSADYFDLLGLRRQYAINEAQLNTAFRTITRYIHPDRFATQNDEVRALATRLSAELNQAVSVLRDPVQRAAYLLELAGGPSAVEVRDVPTALLTEVMTLREGADRARSTGDAETMRRLHTSVHERRGEIMRQITEKAGRLPDCTDDEKNTLRRLLNSVRYFESLLSEFAPDPLATAQRAGNG